MQKTLSHERSRLSFDGTSQFWRVNDGMAAGVDITDLIHRAQRGEADAADVLTSETYEELKKIARARLRGGRRDVLLDTSALVSEWFVRFAQVQGALLEDRVHFFRYAATVMRSVIVDFARRSQADRRGAGAVHVTLPESLRADGGEVEILQIHEALTALAKFDERMAQVVELKYFGGLTESEIAEALALSDRTVRRDWTKARMWLAEALGE